MGLQQQPGTPDIKEEEQEEDGEIEEGDNTAMKVTVEEDVSSTNPAVAAQKTLQAKTSKRPHHFSNHDVSGNFDMSMQNHMSARDLSP